MGCHFLLQGIFNNREEEAKKEKENKRKAKYALFAAAIQEKNSTPLAINLGPPVWDLTLQAPASDATKRDTVLSPAPIPATHQTLPQLQTMGPLENGLSSDTTHQISGSTPGPTAMGQEPDSGGPWDPRPWFLG